MDYTSVKFSFEFFPPRTDAGEKDFWKNIEIFESLKPDYVSVTYGAGGTTKEKTYAIVKRLKEQTSLIPAAHLTCVGATKEEVDNVAKSYLEIGVNKIVALRGDPPNMIGKYQPFPDGYPYSKDLVKGLKQIGDFDIAVACFPEKHPEATTFESDLLYLKEKLDSGAARAITQFCFDTSKIIDLINHAKAIGITKTIVPGIITINNVQQIKSFAARCGASVPSYIEEAFAGIDLEDKNHIYQKAAEIAVGQIKDLIKAGVFEFHLYTLNNPEVTVRIYEILNLK